MYCKVLSKRCMFALSTRNKNSKKYNHETKTLITLLHWKHRIHDS